MGVDTLNLSLVIGQNRRGSHGLCARWYLVIVIVLLDLSTLEPHAILFSRDILWIFLNPSERNHCRITFPDEGAAVVSACPPHDGSKFFVVCSFYPLTERTCLVQEYIL